MKLIDIHTHTQLSDPFQETVLNITQEASIPQQLYSISFHPWHCSPLEDYLAMIEKNWNDKNFLFIGEIGLDIKTQHDFADQIHNLEKIINFIQNQKSKKTILIHNVKAFSYLKKRLYTMKTIWHDFNGNMDELNDLKKNELNYFSIGPSFYKKNSSISKLIDKIPKEKILVETDASTVDLSAHYQQVARALNMDVNELKEQISENFLTVK